MSKLNDLIAELCPDGVKFKSLSEVAEIRRGVRVVKSQLAEEGKYPVYQNSLTPLGYYDKYNCSPNTAFIISAGAASEVGYSFQEFWAADDCLYIEDTLNLSSRFLYHLLLKNQPLLRSNVRKASVPRLSRTVIENLKIPVPPLEVQREIVRILDSFTELTTELIAQFEAELTARKKQYEYYRDLLLTFDETPTQFSQTADSRQQTAGGVKFKKLGEVATYGNERIDAANVDCNSYVGVDNLLPDKQGKTISSYVPNEGRLVRFMAGDILIGNIRPYLKKIWFAEYEGGTNGDVLVIRVTADSLSSKFLYYCLSSDKFFHYAVQFSKGAKMPRGDKSATMDFVIPVPSLEEQERIVKILDRFDRLCNDLSEGLPAEIEARKRQYEFYRDKLLSFDKDWR